MIALAGNAAAAAAAAGGFAEMAASAQTRSSSAVSSIHSLPTSISSSDSVGISSSQCTGEDSVRLWVTELRWYVEADCSNVLHNKAIPQPCQYQLQQQQQHLHKHSLLASPRVSVDMLELCSQRLLAEFNNVLQCLHGNQLKRVHALLSGLTAGLRRFLENMRRLLSVEEADSSGVKFPAKEQSLQLLCTKLDSSNSELLDVYLYAMSLPAIEARFLVVNGHLPPVESLLRHLSDAARAFADVLDSVQLALICRIVGAVRTKTSGANFTAAMRDLLRLSMRSERLSCLVTRAKAVDALLQICSDHCQRKYWPLALRTVSAVCCVEEAIQRFDELNGLATVSAILSQPRHSELVRAEAAGVLAQLTCPCVLAKGKDLLGSLTSHAETLVRALTLLCKEANCHEVFLLASAAVANITFISPASFEYLLKHNTAKALVEACQLSKAASLFAKDQVATVLANMAAYAWCHSALIRANAVELLLHFLSETPRDRPGDPAGRAACERLQQKAAIAVSRLARDPGAAQIAVELSGAVRLAELCRRPEERNCSDAVLVASLAALRQIHDSVGSEDFNERDVCELIRPRISEAFLACSRLDESYV